MVLLLLVVSLAKAQTDIPDSVWAQVDYWNLTETLPDPINFEEFHIVTEPSELPYSQLLSELEQTRLKLNKQLSEDSISIDSVAVFFEETLVNSLFPYWYGTRWDFNGYTNTPREGAIACGYFVSTTLKHMGINWNRYTLAQQASLLEVQTVSMNGTIYAFPNSVADKVVSYIKSNFTEGMYLVGLSSHVGFLLLKDSELFFIHSNYGFPAEVVIERADQSEAFLFSMDFYITPISHNEAFLMKWLSGEEVPVITN